MIAGKLKAIGSIEAGQYWCTAIIAPQQSGGITKLIRTFWHTNESRKLNIADIESAVASAFGVLHDIDGITQNGADPKKYVELVDTIKGSLLSARQGIANLCVTYHDDTNATTLLERISADIERQYKAFETKAL
jgi:hypothetical protein